MDDLTPTEAKKKAETLLESLKDYNKVLSEIENVKKENTSNSTEKAETIVESETNKEESKVSFTPTEEVDESKETAKVSPFGGGDINGNEKL